MPQPLAEILGGPFKAIKKSKCLKSLALLVAIQFTSCESYLDVVPDNVATIENAFKLRNEAEKYLFTCYSFIPIHGDMWFHAGFMGADEIFVPMTHQNYWSQPFRIALGQQNKNTPLFDHWRGFNIGGEGENNKKIFRGIRHCNIFLENIRDVNKVPDLPLDERERWIGEVEFLKAYYHYYLLRMYGPIPIMDGTGSADEMSAPTAVREPVDKVVNYISGLLGQSAQKLPTRIVDENTQLGRITQPIALAIKAKLWLLAASPLFNGNPDYANFMDTKGVALFNSQYDQAKWDSARVATKAAIDAAEANGHALYTYKNDVLQLSNKIKTQLNIRNAITQRWSGEAVWTLSNVEFVNSNLAAVPLENAPTVDRGALRGVFSVPIKVAKLFYSKNGVPIEEDNSLDFSNYKEPREGQNSEQYYVRPLKKTARGNFDREPRFYATLGFDGGVWYMKDGNATGADENNLWVASKNGEKAGFGDFEKWNETGYFTKKLVHWESTISGRSTITHLRYPWPEIRIADLYLMYAEALNEVGNGTEAIIYLDKVRTRAGLNGVVESWTNFSKNPTKYTTKDGLREIIHRERTVELALEGHRFYDLRRWKKAATELNKDITGFNIFGKTVETYNTERFVYAQRFITPRDYLWPIGNYDIRRNPNLVENPGW